jgi:hypothetical protein
VPEKICGNCEYWDGGGEVAAKTAIIGDCHNPQSPYFTPHRSFTCPYFYPDSIRWPGPNRVPAEP